MTDKADTTIPGARPAEPRESGAPRTVPPGAAAQPRMAEPATARALWPTFMRRTLAEDDVQRALE